MNWAKFEKEKYRDIWERGDYTSGNAQPYAEFLIEKVRGNVLELGCGKGVSVDILNQVEGVNCTGVDIVLNGYKSKAPAYEATIWDLPFKDKSFDFSFSTDVMEHIPPEMIEKSLKEIERVTRKKTFHFIATCKAVTMYKGEQVHLTAHDGEWWRDQFIRCCKVESELKFW